MAELSCCDKGLYVTFSLIPTVAQSSMNHNDSYCYNLTVFQVSYISPYRALYFLITNAKGDKMDLECHALKAQCSVDYFVIELDGKAFYYVVP